MDEKKSLEPASMYAIMAQLFAHVSKAVVDRFGEEGREAVKEGVRTFGEQRGRDIARRAALVDEPNGIENYLPNYDMGRSDLFEYETTMHPKEIEQTFTKCAFAEQWKKDGMEEYGIMYCEMIDPAIARGFNPNFEVIHDQYILKEGTCHFRFQMKDEKKEE
ncbi:L-2-amino-thiazoline-4-carboxylic acid hydrolase [Paenibacillus abyssi]|uniref:L-2-amino-thiazoline-4-carboxylic acid hydrolase n=1 Tax=Paenibacillus abyssi TaxID=1340531 RepID=A0A917CT68_9BACL|nr:L-2-amino-thiazoline-4-carboxylic acid hydrolase [Paenibacillus abyssi]GGF97465.1 L-2-amino-thiazoline-4-carboxylic acid hydrolase [Paenibacillus abyssi]